MQHNTPSGDQFTAPNNRTGARVRRPAPTGGREPRGNRYDGAAQPRGSASERASEPRNDGGKRERRAAAGALSSNTAPANCTPTPNGGILRTGIDSLYLSYGGRLANAYDDELATKKLAAQSTDGVERATAQLLLADHTLEVAGRGEGKYGYVLADNWYHMGVSSRNARSMPLAYVQVSSEVLTLAGYEAACSELHTLIAALGEVVQPPKVSRVDLCVDFIWDGGLEFIDRTHWVTRAQAKRSYFHNDDLSSWVVGAGGDLSARLYDKTLELNKSKKDYLKPIWTKAGWDGQQTVWRLEFQFRRPLLQELGIEGLDDLDTKLAGLWRYGTTKWLKLTVPTETDQTQSRWPLHSLWQMLIKADWGLKVHQPLRRVRQSRVPSNHRLFVHGVGAITSFMAIEGITDFDKGIDEFTKAAKHYHANLSTQSRHNLYDYAELKAKEKGRRFNTMKNRREGFSE